MQHNASSSPLLLPFPPCVQTSGWRILYSGRTVVGLWEVWLAHMVAFGVGADEGNSVGVSGDLAAKQRHQLAALRIAGCQLVSWSAVRSVLSA